LPRSRSRVRVPFTAHFLNKGWKSGTSQAQVAELVDAHVSGACVSRRAGSSPVLGTSFIQGSFNVGEVAELVDALL
jgi:hypothetical protein